MARSKPYADPERSNTKRFGPKNNYAIRERYVEKHGVRPSKLSRRLIKRKLYGGILAA